MPYTTEDIARTLRAARQAKGLSQRDLSRRAGLPQGHISRIETGAVDLRVSSLIALARVLGLEIALIPRNAVPAVQAIVRSSSPAFGGGKGSHDPALAAPEAARPAYSLDEDDHA